MTVYIAVDVENLEASAYDYGQVVPLGAIVERAQKEGFPVILRAYADWTEPQITYRMPEYRAFGFELIQLMSDSRGKNTADMMLALDLLETMHMPDCPDAFVVVSGDGDFAPLAAKIRRRSKQYLAMGFRGSSSSMLQRVADQFVFIEDLINDYEIKRLARFVDKPAPLPEAEAAAEALQQTPPPAAEEAVEERIAEPPCPPSPDVEANEAPAVEERPEGLFIPDDPQPLDFSEPASAARSYRRILERCKHVRLEPFEYRSKLVRRAWEVFEDAGNYLVLRDLMGELRDYADSYGIPIYPKGIEMILRTLLIARCFDVDSYEVGGFDLSLRVYPGREIGAEQAINLMNETYIRGITMAMPDVPLDRDGVALLLLDEPSDKNSEMADKIIRKIRPDYDAPTAMQEAWQNALKSRQGGAGGATDAD